MSENLYISTFKICAFSAIFLFIYGYMFDIDLSNIPGLILGFVIGSVAVFYDLKEERKHQGIVVKQ